jgi:2-hydroxy-6-oxonona-2,4-dienedioate hydrolase
MGHALISGRGIKIDSKKKDIILLHGLFGDLSNWSAFEGYFGAHHNIHTPQLPLYKKQGKDNNLDHFVLFLEDYIAENNIHYPILVGNSLGGHIALLYTIKHPEKVDKLILTGSSGLYENSFDVPFPRINDFGFISDKVREVFHNQEAATDDLIKQVFSTIQDRDKALSVVRTAKAARNQNLKNILNTITLPVLLIWGMQDIVTPMTVAEEFYYHLPNSHLFLINNCGHAPMMEQPDEFNNKVAEFIA